MIAALFIGALIGQQTPTPDVAVYKNELCGLAFSHPKTWTVAVKKEDARISIPLQSGAQADLSIYAVRYREPVDIWLLVQKQANVQMNRETVRQWQEEILGIPLLLSKASESSQTGTKISLSGMMYAATERKLTFRLVAPADHYDEAEFQFRQALQTLRTLSGSMPSTEDPNRPGADPKDPKTSKPDKPPKIVVLSRGAGSVKKAEQSIAVKSGGKDLELRFPAGWIAESKSDASLVLKHPELAGEVQVQIASLIDSEPPSRALLRASVESLKAFTKVVTREESIPKANRAGAKAASVWRFGEGAGVPLTTCESVGASADAYWLLKWSKAGSKMAGQEQKLLAALVDAMSVEAKG